ncbi:MAG: AAA family ATPase [Proteobacteria bacterium]|nr:AAA family ATPase [Pseudomonadota bacterium]
MHVQRLTITKLRSKPKLEHYLTRVEGAGWHVILGDNGSGKSTVVRALALALMGQASAHATRQEWARWLRQGRDVGYVSVSVTQHEEDRWIGPGRRSASPIFSRAYIRADVEGGKQNERPAKIKFLNRHAKRTIWGNGFGWFSASFGAFRRFSGGDPRMDRLFMSHLWLAPHLSAFGEDVALGESLLWLQELETKKLEQDDEAAEIQNIVIKFINEARLLPHGARIEGVSSERVEIVDGHGFRVEIQEMSDGYRSILSLTLELMRLLFWAFGTEKTLNAIDTDAGTIALPGVVAIDEVDAHLHPAWQQRIGEWFVARFPRMQFIVTTHSPIICRAARHGSVWLLPAPDSKEELRRVVGSELARLIDGNILDAYGTELFGAEVTRSEQSRDKLDQLARLNRRRLTHSLTAGEQRELEDLRAAMPTSANTAAPR